MSEGNRTSRDGGIGRVKASTNIGPLRERIAGFLAPLPFTDEGATSDHVTFWRVVDTIRWPDPTPDNPQCIVHWQFTNAGTVVLLRVKNAGGEPE